MERYFLRHVDIFGNSLEMRLGDVTITELLEYFESFLKGCGFYIDGSLEIVEREIPMTPEINSPQSDDLEEPTFI